MTDRELATALVHLASLEKRVRTYWATVPVQDLPERDASLVAMRHAVALRKSVEAWMTARACRAALQS